MMYGCLSVCLLVLCAAEHDVMDGLALVQKSVDAPSQSWMVSDTKTGLVRANRAHQMQKQASVSLAVNRGVKRLLDRFPATSKANTITSVLKWSMTGKLTEWVMGFYREPKEASELTAVDSLIGMITRAMDEDSQKLSNDELLVRIMDWSALHKLAKDYATAEGELKEIMDVVDVVGDALEAKKPTTLTQAVQTANDAMRDMSSMPMAGLVKYLFDALIHKPERSLVKLSEKLEPAMKEAGFPESCVTFVMQAIDDKRTNPEKKSSSRAEAKEYLTRLAFMLAETSSDLNLPMAVPEFFSSFGELIAAPWATTGAETLILQIATVGTQLTKAMEALHLPQEVANLAFNSGKCWHQFSGDTKRIDPDLPYRCIGQQVANMTLAIGHPPALVRFIDYCFDMYRGGNSTDFTSLELSTQNNIQATKSRLFLEALEEVGFPPSYTKWLRGHVQKAFDGTLASSPEDEARYKLEAMRFMGMPALAQLIDHGKILFGHKYAVGEVPDGEELFRFFVSLLDVPGDFQRAQTLARTLKKKLIGPVDNMFAESLKFVTEEMPDSFLKRVALRRSHALSK